tara:strand:- start:22996 stop:23673 length:678 start_codon:yes stop_codon:yes gene_type:complete
MYWEDEGFILSKRKFRENAIILEIFTKNNGKVSGIVYGGTSRKVKNYLQITNKIFVVFNAKAENKIGYFKTELIEAISPKYFNDTNKTICLNSLSSILKVLLPENQTQSKIYKSLDFFLKKLNEKKWVLYYLNWEIDLIHDLGFGFNFETKSYSTGDKNKLLNIKVDDVTYKIPSFIIERNFNNIDNKDIYNGLNFSRNLMENKFFSPNNLRFPYSRKLLEEKIL